MATFNTSTLQGADALTATYLDPALLPLTASLLSQTGYADARLAFLLAGLLLIFLLAAGFAAGCTCACCRALDVMSGELWVSGEAALEAPPAGHEDDPRYQLGAKAAGFTAQRKHSPFGGLMALCGAIVGLALCGDVLMGYALSPRCVRCAGL